MGAIVSVRFQIGPEGRARSWRHYLPADSQAIQLLREPATVLIEGIMSLEPSDKTSGPSESLFTHVPLQWGSTGYLVDAFAQLWPEMVEAIAGATPGCVNLVYFSGVPTNDELLSLIPFMPFESRSGVRFFVSEIYRESRAVYPVSGQICVEYDYESFKQLAGPEAFTYPYGSTLMGVSVAESKVPAFLRMPVIGKDSLEESLKDQDLRCWWLVDTDFEGLTVWHKDIGGADMAKHLRAAINARAKELGFSIEG